MARYVMANRRAGKFQESEKRASRAAMETSFATLAANVDVINDRNPTDPLARRVVVFDADPEEVAARSTAMSNDVIVEPEILHYPVTAVAGMVVPLVEAPAAAPLTTFAVFITGAGGGLRGAEVLLFSVDQMNRQQQMKAFSDATGAVSFAVPPTQQVVALVVLPAGGFWSMVARNPVNGVTVDCPRIADAPGGAIDWWHKLLGINTFDPNRGTGIKVGVIDTGAGPHGCLAHVIDTGAFINGAHIVGGGADVDSHGSHVCGTIGARPVAPNERGARAPAATLMIARVFPDADTGASQADISNALDELSRARGADLINMSLGSPSRSNIEQDAIRDALERGTLCVCAAGNDMSGPVSFPAAFDESVAISAIGLRNTAPAGSLSAGRVPTDPAKLAGQNLYLANFSNVGSQVDACAPGVGIVATVPQRFGLTRPYAAMDGTSMASPVACGALAALLADRPSYKALTGAARAEEARAVLRTNCQSIGLATIFQGAGTPRVP